MRKGQKAVFRGKPYTTRRTYRDLSFEQIVEFRKRVSNGEAIGAVGDSFGVRDKDTAKLITTLTEWYGEELPPFVEYALPENPPGEATEYRTVVGYPYYKIGNNGEVWSCLCKTGTGRSHRGWLRLASYIDKKGYVRYSLRKKPGDRNQISYGLHKLLMDAFVGPRPDGYECRHIDDNKLNNDLSNLAWGTHAENTEDRDRNGKTLKGEKHPLAKLTEEKVRDIRRRSANGESRKSIAQDYGINPGSIASIIKFITWKEVKDV